MSEHRVTLYLPARQLGPVVLIQLPTSTLHLPRAFIPSAISERRTRSPRLTTVLACLALAACAVPAAAQAGATPALSAFDSAKVHALLQSRLPCLGCHTLGGRVGTIGPDLTNVSKRRSAAYIESIIAYPQRVVPGTIMPTTPMPASMRALVIAYMTGGRRRVSAVPDSIRGPARPGRTANGAALYIHYCAACHGERGGGDGPNASHLPVRPARHADASLMSGMSDARLFDAIAGGGYPMGRSAMMPGFGATLTREEIGSLVGHLRVLCRCEGPAWSRTRAISPRGLP